ncbi:MULTISPECIES: HAMP domain-containing sensor histidine kinase [Spirosoma]|uniref:histidine kinase n=1 Tax=Spirosoma liriopis TaxID=2937440 RepID=A0ABT0HM64_9BACT|nr:MULTISPECIES: ATP-binding protein [Spirosoma]MCK8492650.1 ATP-binding protein [Spirosoma liriopis]UHG92118.1 ATP-binding protein [Spirosoma oryzicola]
MKIRARLSLTFVGIVAAILLLFSFVVYATAEYYRQRDFYLRLSDKAKTTARLLLDEDEITTRLLRVIEQNNLTALPEEQINVYGQDNRMLYATQDSAIVKPEVLTLIREKKEVFFREKRKEIIGFIHVHNKQEYILVASAHDQYGLEEMQHLGAIMVMGLLCSLALMGAAGWAYAGRSLRPISDVVQQVSRITASNLDQRVSAGNDHDELSQLAHTFNLMLDRVQEAFEMQRNFVSNASHELRTPLTIITGQIEVTLLKRRTVEEHEAKWKAVLEVIHRMNKLTNNLLDLTLVNLESTPLKFSEVSVDEVIYQASQMLANRQPDYSVVFSFAGQMETIQPSLTIAGNKSLLYSAFFNLMENGCKFSENKQVQVTLGANERWVTVVFKDEGVGILESDIKRIYEPFFRAENVKRIHGHGVGLPLTYRIIQLHRGQIEVTSEINRGTTFTVHLPKKF